MRVFTIAWREFRQYFTGVGGYIFVLLYMVILGLIFISSVQPGQPLQTGVINSAFLTLALFTAPFMTMRTFAGERQRGTLELLQLTPVTHWQLVIGKWLGVFGLALVIVLTALWLPISALLFANLDLGSIYAVFFGALCVFAATLAIGIFSSVVAKTVLASVAISSVITLTLWVIGLAAATLELGLIGLPESVTTVIRYSDLSSHFRDSFAQGVIDSSDLIYFASLTIGFLSIATASLQRQR